MHGCAAPGACAEFTSHDVGRIGPFGKWASRMAVPRKIQVGGHVGGGMRWFVVNTKQKTRLGYATEGGWQRVLVGTPWGTRNVYLRLALTGFESCLP